MDRRMNASWLEMVGFFRNHNEDFLMGLTFTLPFVN